MDEPLRTQVRAARGKFAAMAATYCLGVFNDSFFRTAAIFMVVYAGRKDMASPVMMVFAVPYLLFAAPAGWLADRFSKRRIVIGAKVLELSAMACGAVGIVTFNWYLILAMVFMMGLQSCLFSPALNGSIPELYPESYVMKANAILKVVVTVSILAGVALSGPALGVESAGPGGVPLGRWIIAAVVLVVSVLGVVVSLGVPRRPAADPQAAFPWTGPVETLRELGRIGKDALLAVVVAADAFVWFVGAVIILLVPVMAKDQFGLGAGPGGLMVAAELVGVAAGGLIGSRLATGARWYRVLAPAALAMGVLMAAMAAVPCLPGPARLPVAFALLGLIGAAGGVFMIPCEAFVQVRPAPQRKGAVIAAVNFVVFAGIVLSWPAVYGLNRLAQPTAGFAALGALAMLAAGALRVALPRRRRT